MSRPVTRADFEFADAWGLATSIDLSDCDPDAIRSADAIERFTSAICVLLEVRRIGEPRIVRIGNDSGTSGYSMMQLIQSSLVSAHFVEESNAAHIDLVCCKWYDAAAAAHFASDFFGATNVRVHTNLRK